MKYLVSLVSIGLLAGCATPVIKIEPVPVTEKISILCIDENKQVFMDGFLPEVREQIENRSIKTQMLQSGATCPYVLSYNAEWSWDWLYTWSVYLSKAEFYVKKDGNQIGMASYETGLGFSALGHTKTKIYPLLVELFRK